MGLYFHHPSSLLHDTGLHPENASRIRAIESLLERSEWPGLDPIEAPVAEREWLARVHDRGLIDAIERFCAAGGGSIDPDTVVVPESWEAALRASGSAAVGAERLLAGEDRYAFCGLRPPGHHAESRRAMGFCLFNHAAVAAAHAIAACGAERVLIFDWDVHHGNGTAEIFDRRSDVLYASIHQSPFYPGTGAAGETGSGEGEGATINLPVPAGADGRLFCGLTEHVVVPLARGFEPDLIIVSAGYDAHVADPLANCLVGTGDYATMAAHMRDLGVPVLVCLEGGYDPEALAASVLATVEALAGDRPPVATEVAAVTSTLGDAIDRVAATPRWRSVF
jgi:acetoin utilization deacetylase AcuC-like enzyme